MGFDGEGAWKSEERNENFVFLLELRSYQHVENCAGIKTKVVNLKSLSGARS